MHFAYLVNGLPEIYPQISLGEEDAQSLKKEYAFLMPIRWLIAHRPFLRSLS